MSAAPAQASLPLSPPISMKRNFLGYAKYSCSSLYPDRPAGAVGSSASSSPNPAGRSCAGEMAVPPRHRTRRVCRNKEIVERKLQTAAQIKAELVDPGSANRTSSFMDPQFEPDDGGEVIGDADTRRWQNFQGGD